MDLSGLAGLSGIDPYIEAQKGPMERQQFEMKKMAQQQAYDEAIAEQKQKQVGGLPQMAGQQPQGGLGQMAGSFMPQGTVLQNPDGSFTKAGELNRTTMLSKTEASKGAQLTSQADKILKQAKMLSFSDNPEDQKTYKQLMDTYKNLDDAGRRMLESSERHAKDADEKMYDLIGGGIIGGMFANPKSYKDVLSKWEKNSGIPLPADFPREWTPETREKLQAYVDSLPSAKLQEKINKEIAQRDKDIFEAKKRPFELTKLDANTREAVRKANKPDFADEPTSSPSAYVYNFTGTKLKDADAEKVTTATNAIGDAAGLKQMVEEHPEWSARKGQFTRFVQRYITSFKDGKVPPELPDEFKQKGVDMSQQEALIFAKRYAEYLVNYERSLAGGARGFTVQFQKRFNEIMGQDQFTAQGFKNLMDEQTRSLRSGAITLAPGADAKKLNAMALDQKTRAEDDYAVRGLTGEKKKSPAKEESQGPKAGDVVDGYTFKGGDPSKKENWEKVK